LFGHYGYVEMIKLSMKIIFFYVGYLLVHSYASFMVISIACGASRPVYGDVYTVEGYIERIFLNMDDSVTFGLVVFFTCIVPFCLIRNLEAFNVYGCVHLSCNA
jgi:hypothetical protein